MPPPGPRPADLVLLALAGLVVVACLFVGARAQERPPPARRPHSLAPHGDLLAASVAARAGIDPLAPPGLPSGARIDPVTGYLDGLDLGAGADTLAPSWALLASVNGVEEQRELPVPVLALDGRKVVLAGFVNALYDLHAMREFLLVGNHYVCCFGRPADVGDQVVVRLAPDQAPLDLTLRPVRVEGTLRVRPQREHASGRGRLLWLYEIDLARVSVYDG